MDVEFRLRTYYFPNENIVFVTAEKIASSFFDFIIQKYKPESNFFYLNFNNNQIDFTTPYGEEFFLDKTITEKQYKIFLQNFLDDIENKNFIFLTRNPEERFRSGIFQIMKGYNENFYSVYDFLNGYSEKTSVKLIETFVKRGSGYFSNNEYEIFKNLFLEWIAYAFSEIKTDSHITPHNLYLHQILKIEYFKKIKLIDLKQLDDFLINNDILTLKQIEASEKNKQIFKFGNEYKSFLEYVYEISNIKNINSKYFNFFHFYCNFYLQNEFTFYNKLLEQYGEKE